MGQHDLCHKVRRLTKLMLKVWGRFAAVGLIAALSAYGAAQAPQPAPPVQDKSARSEIRVLRAKVDSLSKRLEEKPAAADSQAVERIAKDLDSLAAKREQPTNSWAWGVPAASMALLAAIAYWIGVSQKGRSYAQTLAQPDEPPIAGEISTMGGKKAALSRIRAKMVDLERDVRMYAGIYSLLLDQQSARNGPLQRLAEISTREQEALLRYRSTSGEIVALGYDYGPMPYGPNEDGQSVDLGDWLGRWWSALDDTLLNDADSPEQQTKRDELFRSARMTLKGLAEESAEAVPSGNVSVL